MINDSLKGFHRVLGASVVKECFPNTEFVDMTQDEWLEHREYGKERVNSNLTRRENRRKQAIEAGEDYEFSPYEMAQEEAMRYPTKASKKTLQDPKEVGDVNSSTMQKIQATVGCWRTPKVTDPEEMATRFDDYFKTCIELGVPPTMEGLAISCGYTRQELAYMATEKRRSGVGYADVIKFAKEYCALQVQTLAAKFEVQPVWSIFYSKNNFDYVDKIEHVVTRDTSLDGIEASEELAARIRESMPEPDYDIE